METPIQVATRLARHWDGKEPAVLPQPWPGEHPIKFAHLRRDKQALMCASPGLHWAAPHLEEPISYFAYLTRNTFYAPWMPQQGYKGKRRRGNLPTSPRCPKWLRLYYPAVLWNTDAILSATVLVLPTFPKRIHLGTKVVTIYSPRAILKRGELVELKTELRKGYGLPRAD